MEYPGSVEIRVRIGYVMKCYEKERIRIKDHESMLIRMQDWHYMFIKHDYATYEYKK